MFDNITVNEKTGLIVLLEDVGGAAHNGKIWLYDPATDALTQIAQHDPARFGDVGVRGRRRRSTRTRRRPASSTCRRSSGPGIYLTSDQAHYPINATHPARLHQPGRTGRGRSAAGDARPRASRGRRSSRQRRSRRRRPRRQPTLTPLALAGAKGRHPVTPFAPAILPLIRSGFPRTPIARGSVRRRLSQPP